MRCAFGADALEELLLERGAAELFFEELLALELLLEALEPLLALELLLDEEVAPLLALEDELLDGLL